jgi:UDP-glucose 4-epimerase
VIQNLQATAKAPKRVVILGAKGFIGSRLALSLSESKIEVLGLSSKDVDLIEPSSVDLLATQLKADDVVVLVSALTPDKGRDFGTLIRNLQMANHLLLALKKTKVEHVFAISSDAVYEDEATLVRETTLRAPGTFHGVMHLARETALTQSCKELQIPLGIIRPSAVFGPGDTHRGYGPNRFLVTALEKGEIALFGGGEEQRDHVFIDDVIQLISLCIQHRTTGVINAVSGTAVSFMQVAEKVAESIQKRLGKTVEIKPSARQNPITHKHFDIAQLLATFPALRRTSLAEGVEKSLTSILAQ